MHSNLKISSKVIAKAMTSDLHPNPFFRNANGELSFKYDEIVVENFLLTFKYRGTAIAELPTKFACGGERLNICSISGEVGVTISQC